jgi:DNA-binding PadR family transcriptional regulator
MIMAKGLLNLWMLKIISESEVSGYDIIKKVGELTGKKPSTGSVYPLLKSMETKRWITGKNIGNKTLYKITKAGNEVVEGHGDLKDYYSEKIHESICLAHETFDDLHLAFSNNRNLLAPLANEISLLIEEGIALDEIKKIIQITLEKLKKLKKRGK